MLKPDTLCTQSEGEKPSPAPKAKPQANFLWLFVLIASFLAGPR